MRPSSLTGRRLAAGTAIALLALAAVAGGCSSDDDGELVRDTGSSSASGSGAGSGAGSGSGSGASASGSGLSEEELAGTSDDPLVQKAVEDYHAYVVDQSEALVDDVKVFTDAVRSGDIEAAKAAYAPSRQRWEAIEPIAGLVEDIDVAVDARADDFESEDDPAWTGWHKLEYLLWERGDISGAGELADDLDGEIAELAEKAPDLEVTPLAVARGSQELIEEVSEGKITGEEDRYSHTDLWDFDANVDGSRKAIDLLSPALEKADPELLTEVNDGFVAVDAALAPYADGEGWQSYEAVTEEDLATMKAALAGLSESLSQVPAALGLG